MSIYRVFVLSMPGWRAQSDRERDAEAASPALPRRRYIKWLWKLCAPGTT